MDRSFNQGESRKDEDELVEFHSEMPEVPDDDFEFIPDEKPEDEIEEEL